MKISTDVLKNLSLGKLAQAMSHEEDMTIIRSINDQITHFLEYYSVSLYQYCLTRQLTIFPKANINAWMSVTVHDIHQTQVMVCVITNNIQNLIE